MGGTTFTQTVVAPDAATAFSRASEEAAWEYGHGGYTGTIAEKPGYRMLAMPSGLPEDVTPDDIVTLALELWSDTPLEIRRSKVDDSKGYKRWVADTPITLDESFRPAIAAIHDAVDDKWGDAGCFEVTKPEGPKTFLFFGWASC